MNSCAGGSPFGKDLLLGVNFRHISSTSAFCESVLPLVVALQTVAYNFLDQPRSRPNRNVFSCKHMNKTFSIVCCDDLDDNDSGPRMHFSFSFSRGSSAADYNAQTCAHWADWRVATPLRKQKMCMFYKMYSKFPRPTPTLLWNPDIESGQTETRGRVAQSKGK